MNGDLETGPNARETGMWNGKDEDPPFLNRYFTRMSQTQKNAFKLPKSKFELRLFIYLDTLFSCAEILDIPN